MPDKDYIHTKVERYYSSLMDALRADSFDEQKISDAINKGLKENLIENGNAPIRLISKISRVLEKENAKTPLERQNTKWTSLKDQIDNIVLKDNGKKRAKEFVRESSLKIINRLKQGSKINSVGFELTREYVGKVFVADCVEKIPISIPDDDSFNREEILNRLKKSDEIKEEFVQYYSKHLFEKESVKKIRRKPSGKKEKIDLNEDIGIE